MTLVANRLLPLFIAGLLTTTACGGGEAPNSDGSLPDGGVGDAGQTDADSGSATDGAISPDGSTPDGGSIFPLQPSMRRRISAFGKTTCAINDNSEVICWGNDFGGPGPYTAMKGEFLTITTGENVQKLGREKMVCGILSSGELRCALWDGKPLDLPVNIQAMDFIDVAGSNNELAVLTTSGRVRLFGWYDEQYEGPPGGDKVVRVAYSGGVVCGIGEGGEALCWEKGKDSLPRVITGNYVDIATGDWQSCAVTDTGKIRCWDDEGGEFRSLPEEVDSYRIVQLASSRQGSRDKWCALVDDGRPICGDFGKAYPTTLPEEERLVEVAVGEFHYCGIRPDDTVLCWYCEIGDEQCAQITTPPPGFKATPR